MMLGYDDIVKALGTDIGIVPFKKENIKGNALNLCVSEYAWSLNSGKFKIDDKGQVCSSILSSDAKEYSIKERESAVIEFNQSKYVVILPSSTTLIETQEVIAISNRIGGTYHSKVNIVSKGLCHIGTYLEPNFRGHSLIAVQNPGEMAVLLEVGKPLTAITFFYLKSAAAESLIGAPGSRFDILAQYRLQIPEDAKAFLSNQWKNDSSEIKHKMQTSKEYIRFMNDEKKKRRKNFSGYFNKRNLVVILTIIVVLGILYYGAYRIDIANENTIWTDRFWNVGASGILVAFVSMMVSLIKNEKK